MSRYQNEEQAAADGFRFAHEPERSRYALYAADAGSGADGRPGTGDGSGTGAERLVGEAHYTLRGAGSTEDPGIIDFDHTVVAPALRGTGLSGLLARRALTGDAIGDRRVLASCWFIEGYLAKHPELLERG
ncbi:N-acetyltransferase [Leucobacter zeae]|nr:N-acetyltransferase [Leucobacter zeae]